MLKNEIWDLIIIGGGLAGLTCALDLSKSKLKVLLIEKQKYPHHKVCGEYVSNEILPYIKSLGIDPMKHGAKSITKFEISNRNSRKISTDLPLGGFGISRFTLDNLFYQEIKEKIEVIFETVNKIDFIEEGFSVSTNNKEFLAKYVVGAFGKRSNLDAVMQRGFMQKSSPWLAVKAHYHYHFPEDTVALHNFEGGYCGLSKTETNAVNACYLTTYRSFKRFGNIPDFQNNVLTKNKYLDHFFQHAEPIFDKPLTISQVSFDQKQPVEQHIFMIGDSAGLIHPLCGNGMAMAIHSAKIFAETFSKHFNSITENRIEMEQEYSLKWNQTFSSRLQTGRAIQQLLLRPVATTVGFSIARMFPDLVPKIIRKTHGTPVV